MAINYIQYLFDVSMGGGGSKEGRQVKHFYFGQVSKKKSYNKEFITVNSPIRSKDDFDEWKQKY